ncbi:MAG: glutathione S-transferase N-terminal domain-containing protein [Alphaproteobacteria bacterium]|nr:glutathione S-transferase N-terminal domain-containing protein [Alphaproteobacteria bacterium]
MIQLYTFGTPNGRKASIMLEEVGFDYEINVINILDGDQHTSEYLAINPNGKIPAIVDPDGPDGKPISVFESGAILIYLAEKSGKLLPEDPRKRMAVIEWLMFQMGGVGPMFGQTNHFRRFAKQEVPYAIERYTNEARRLYGVMDKRLGAVDFLAGDYSIADVATYPWCARHDWHGVELSEFPNLKRWYETIAGRPAVERGMAVPPS